MGQGLTIEFWVPGIPRPQGSKRGFSTPKGKVIMVEMSKALPGWRADVRAEAMKHAPDSLLEGPLWLHAEFVFSRPKAHYYTGKRSHLLRANALEYVTKAPDLSKLIRGIEDAMESILFKNDSQIAYVVARKTFGDSPGVRVTLSTVRD